MIRFSGSTIVDTTYTSDGTKSQMVNQITGALMAAGWTSLGSSVYQSALTPQGFQIQVDVIPSTGSWINLRIRSPDVLGVGFSNGAFVNPVLNRVYRIIANKYQLFHFYSGSLGTTDPSDVAFGVPWMPPFIPPFQYQTVAEEDLINSTTTTGDDCLGRVYFTYNFGPFSQNVNVHVYGRVDDDIQVNGVILDEGLFPFNSGRGVPCDNIANGIHSFDHIILIPAGTPIVINIINNFAGSCGMNGHISITSVSGETGPDPWYGWMSSNALDVPGSGRNANTAISYRAFLPFLGYGNDIWIWDGVAFWDSGGGDNARIICQMGRTDPQHGGVDNSAYWADGSLSIYEPYISWPFGHTTSGNWTVPSRRGQLWDSMIYGDLLPASEVVLSINNQNWRNMTIPTNPGTGGANQILHSLLHLTN